MKKILLISILFFNFSFGQSKKETEEWIASKYDFYKSDIYFEKNNTLLFDNGNLYVMTQNTDEITYQKISLKDISEIFIEYTGEKIKSERYHIELICKVNQNCIEHGKYVSGNFIPERQGGRWKIEGKNKKYFLTLTLDKSFKKDDLPMRMEKALFHLIKLYGGNAKKYVHPKETF
ncbi:hypothetical protein [Flavobacterium channae]|uniref:hypothetical protein n=1 Tax=Flavobacterium channae TaxID=2897181 RepID=UPI001E391F53|nr:hypothetical protein [Flavobacterium channae]UGS22915.1 hypothetical protein LOS89_09060 [Flavobacterium channae]